MIAIARIIYQKTVEKMFLNAWHIADLGVAGVEVWDCGVCVKVESMTVFLGQIQVICRSGRTIS